MSLPGYVSASPFFFLKTLPCLLAPCPTPSAAHKLSVQALVQGRRRWIKMGRQRAMCSMRGFTTPAKRKSETGIVKRMAFTGVKTYCRQVKSYWKSWRETSSQHLASPQRSYVKNRSAKSLLAEDAVRHGHRPAPPATSSSAISRKEGRKLPETSRYYGQIQRIIVQGHNCKSSGAKQDTAPQGHR